MSAEATLAVMEHGQSATSTPAEWQMLMLLANESDRHGVVTGVSMADLAERMGKSERGVAGVKKGLKASGTLVVLEEGGGRGHQAVYWLALPGLAGPQETPQKSVETPQPATPKESETPQSAGGSGEGRSISSSTTSSSSGIAAKEKEFLAVATASGVFDPAADPEPDELLDGLGLLRTGKKVGGKLVTPVEMAIAAACIAVFNRDFEWNGKKGSDYGIGANLTSIVERARERPSWDVTKHVRLVESAWRVRWWESRGSDRRPHPNVIYGGKSFDNVVQDAGDEAAGEAPAAIKKRRYTRG